MKTSCLGLIMAMVVVFGCSETEPVADEQPIFVNTGICFDPEAVPYLGIPDTLKRPCLHAGDCDEYEHCNKSPSCKGEGWCVGLQACIDESRNYPVCTCAGFTVSAPCGASRENGSLTACSECPSCETNDDCEEDQFCNAWLDCAAPGGCGVRPEHCQDVDDPVCGCDGVAYKNECEAWAAGVRVAGRGACECYTSEDCGPDGYCIADTCDGPGVCASAREECDSPNGSNKRTVCGCDGIFYWNECRAGLAQAKIGNRRECEWP